MLCFFGTFSLEVATEGFCLVFQIAFKLLNIYRRKFSAIFYFGCHKCTFLLSSDKKNLMKLFSLKKKILLVRRGKDPIKVREDCGVIPS